VVVEGRKVMVEIDTTKVDSFFYDPTWDTPLIEVEEADYTGELVHAARNSPKTISPLPPL
jgi:hypothetical protein